MELLRKVLAFVYERFYTDYRKKTMIINDFKLVADKGVHKPGESCIFFFKILKNYIKPTDAILDIGAGCGILEILLSNYAKKVVGVEINEKAVACARKNVILNKIGNVEIRQSDMFENIKKEEKFDLITMNPPAFNVPIKKVADYSYIDTDHRIINSFFKDVSKYMKQNSKVIVMYPEVWKNILENLAKKYGFKFDVIAQKKNVLYKHMLVYYFIKN